MRNKSNFSWHFIYILIFYTILNSTQAKAFCGDNSLALQILGSGGPIADDSRASSGYLLWINGKSRLMVDAGGGTFLRFGEAKARIEDLNLLAISHFHTDHVADLPAILKGGFFSSRQRPLAISGPSGNYLFPDTQSFFKALFEEKQGAFRYLFGFLQGNDGLFKLDLTTIDATKTTPTIVFKNDEMRVSALAVPHGAVPALAYRVDLANNKSIVFSSDQNGSVPEFIHFAKGADVLIMPFAIPERAGRIAKRLHATPSVIGKVAAQAEVGTLVLSHFMRRSLNKLDLNLSFIKKYYSGRLILAEDLQCILMADDIFLPTSNQH